MSCSLVYCHCAYADVLPAEVKTEVLRRLSDAGVAFEAVPDLCEMSARKDPRLARIAGTGQVRIAACFPRAVEWLFHAAGAPIDDAVEVLNMREMEAGELVDRLLADADFEATPGTDDAAAGPAGTDGPGDGDGETVRAEGARS